MKTIALTMVLFATAIVVVATMVGALSDMKKRELPKYTEEDVRAMKRRKSLDHPWYRDANKWKKKEGAK